MKDLEIENNCKKEKILDISKKLGIDNIEKYGEYKAKIQNNLENKINSKLILVTATTPTEHGEGKTTVTIGLVDAINKLNKKAVGVLREPSLGPVFGMKGGATGGGFAQVIPSLDINLHFNGDIHAITSANNLLASAIDNHIYYGNKLNIDKVVFKRCIDINDRSLREKFDITAASELMALFCLSSNLEELKLNIENIIIGYDKDGKEILAKELEISDAMTILLKDAFNPNLVQTLENNPVLIHGGPFANIAHGCSSINSLNLALKTSEYTITEAGFASELGCEKFMNITSRKLGKQPDAIILVTTLKALEENGYENLDAHIESLKTYNKKIVVALNKFEQDKGNEILNLKKYVEKLDVDFSIVDAYSKGSDGCLDLAKIVIEIEKNNNLEYTYELDDSIEEKINKVAKKIYHAGNIIYSDLAKKKIKKLEKYKYPICISKTQYSISDNKNLKGYPKNFDITIKDVEVKNGAKYITIYLNNVITMPGLPRNPNYEKMKLINDKFTN